MTFIGIDVGTSFIKGAVLDLEEFRLDHVRRLPFPARVKLDNPLLAEFDPREVSTAVRSLIEDLLRSVRQCDGIVMCSQMHGMVLLNRKGEAASNCISWTDHRGLMPHPSGAGTYFDVLMTRTSDAQRKRLGNELSLERPVCFLFWLAEQGLLDNSLTPASIPDYIMRALCGDDPGIEPTNASATGLFNLGSGAWDREVMDALGLSGLQLPAIRKPGEIVGYYNTGSHQVPCFTPVGDFQCALLGALLNVEELSLNISTGAQVSRLTAQLNLGDHQTRPFFGGQFVSTYSDAPGGRALNVLLGLLADFTAHQQFAAGTGDRWALIADAVKNTPATSLTVDPRFFQAAADAGGWITNIRGDNLTVGQLFRASFNAMASIYFSFGCRLWPEKGWKNVVFSGGLALKLEIFREIIQQQFQTGCRLAPFAEDTLFGLLLLARVFSGRDSGIRDYVQVYSTIHNPAF